ncbi:MAG TPA: histidinol dehydrogenase, partial [Levilinea sp.]|nr:histidinol dehydrogenase [Levilinea sp.]
MFPKYDLPTAREGILKRVPFDETVVPPVVQERITALFGESLTAAQAVDRILQDVRRDGDAGLRKWAGLLDGGAPEGFAVSPGEMRQALDDLPATQRAALALAIDRVRRFHQAQPVTSWMINALGGTVGQYVRPIRR